MQQEINGTYRLWNRWKLQDSNYELRIARYFKQNILISFHYSLSQCYYTWKHQTDLNDIHTGWWTSNTQHTIHIYGKCTYIYLLYLFSIFSSLSTSSSCVTTVEISTRGCTKGTSTFQLALKSIELERITKKYYISLHVKDKKKIA